MKGVRFGTRSPSETALCFFDDGRLLTITRARGYCALTAIAQPLYEEWEYYLSEESRCYGAAVARVASTCWLRVAVLTTRGFGRRKINLMRNLASTMRRNCGRGFFVRGQ